MRFFANPRAERALPYGPEQSAVLNQAGHAAARAEIATWAGYRPTPLVALPGLARELGIGALFYKDESHRFGLKSFKPLGGAYAVFRVLQREIARRGGPPAISSAELAAGGCREIVEDLTVACATDGNHGRAVAWGARMFGCRSVIFINEDVSEGRETAIAAYGATVERVPGSYDDAVRHAAETAARQGWFVVSDTAYGDYAEVPCHVMHGYTVMAEEAREQLPTGANLSHVFVQGGVGGLAAAVCGQYWQDFGAARPRLIVVEPDRADCLYQSARAGTLTGASGDLNSIMMGLACGEVSTVAWPVLATGADAFITVPDEAAVSTMRRLAEAKGDPAIVGGESGVAGLAGLITAIGDDDARAALDLGPDAQALVFGSEGDTDPELYARIVGRSGDAVRGAA